MNASQILRRNTPTKPEDETRTGRAVGVFAPEFFSDADSGGLNEYS